MNGTAITKIEVKALWNKYDILWDNLDPRVNILVGENGSGKSNLLRLVADAGSSLNNIYQKNILFEYIVYDLSNQAKYCVTHLTKTIPHNFEHINKKDLFRYRLVKEDGFKYGVINYGETPVVSLLQTFENKFHNPTDTQDIIGKEVQTNLDLGLWQLEKDFKSYQSKILNQYRREKDEKIFAKSDLFKQLMNDFFSVTYKNIEITDASDIFIEQTDEYTQEKLRLTMYDLSSGEKQLLIIMLTVLLSNNENMVLLLDEPEVSLHIGWQQKLIDSILQLNENCQLIIATHSPSIFGKNWGKHVTFMKNIKHTTTKNIENKEPITQ